MKFRIVDRRLGSGRRSAHTDENVDTAVAKSGKQTSEPREISREAGGGIHRSSVSQIIHKVLRLNCCKEGALNSLLKRTGCTRYFRYAV